VSQEALWEQPIATIRQVLSFGARPQRTATAFRKSLKNLRIAQRRAVAETDNFGLQGSQSHDRLPILHRVRTESRRGEPQARLVREKMNVGEHVARDKQSIAAAK
jgi:hypothetical protein